MVLCEGYKVDEGCHVLVDIIVVCNLYHPKVNPSHEELENVSINVTNDDGTGCIMALKGSVEVGSFVVAERFVDWEGSFGVGGADTEGDDFRSEIPAGHQTIHI